MYCDLYLPVFSKQISKLTSYLHFLYLFWFVFIYIICLIILVQDYVFPIRVSFSPKIGSLEIRLKNCWVRTYKYTDQNRETLLNCMENSCVNTYSKTFPPWSILPTENKDPLRGDEPIFLDFFLYRVISKKKLERWRIFRYGLPFFSKRAKNAPPPSRWRTG